MNRNILVARAMRSSLSFCVLLLFLFIPHFSLFAIEESLGQTPLRENDDLIRREELGVNPITAPSIQELLVRLESFGPIPDGFLSSNPRRAVFPNRFQTALHFGSLVADGLLLTIAEREEDLLDLSRALVQNAKSLSVSDRLAERGKSLLDLSSRGDWLGMRRELIQTQVDVEESMMDLKDDVLADIISLGGWLRGFQFACTVTDSNYVSQRARMLVDGEVMDYYIDRLENLPPQLRRTELVQDMTNTLKQVRDIISEAPDQGPSPEDVHRLKLLADHLFADTIAPTNSKGEFRSG